MNRPKKQSNHAVNIINRLTLSVLGVFVCTAPSYAAPGANLRVTSGTVSDSAAEAGEIIDLTARVKNTGTKTAKRHFTEFLLSADTIRDSQDTELSVVSTNKLSARKRAVVSDSVTIPVITIGAYNILACADARNNVRESNEQDNCKNIGAFEVTSTPISPTPTPTSAPPSNNPTATPTPGSSSIFSFSVDPVVLGDQPIAPTSEELLAGWRTVTMTNISNSTSPTFDVFGYGRRISPTNDGIPSANGDITINGPTYCRSGQSLAPGDFCTMSVYWSENTQPGPHTGAIDIYHHSNPPVLLATLPVSQTTNSRTRFDVRDVSVNNGSNAYAGLVIGRTVTLTNVGNQAIGGSVLVVRAAVPSTGDGGFRINHSAGSDAERCTSKPIINPGDTCEVRIEFCSTRVGTSTDGWQVFSSNGLVDTPVSPLGTLSASMQPQLDIGDTCSGYSAER